MTMFFELTNNTFVPIGAVRLLVPMDRHGHEFRVIGRDDEVSGVVLHPERMITAIVPVSGEWELIEPWCDDEKKEVGARGRARSSRGD